LAHQKAIAPASAPEKLVLFAQLRPKIAAPAAQNCRFPGKKGKFMPLFPKAFAAISDISPVSGK